MSTLVRDALCQGTLLAHNAASRTPYLESEKRTDCALLPARRRSERCKRGAWEGNLALRQTLPPASTYPSSESRKASGTPCRRRTCVRAPRAAQAREHTLVIGTL